MHAPLGNDFTVEMGQLLLEPDILHQHGTTGAGSEGMIVVGHGRTGARGQAVFPVVHVLSPLVCAPQGAVAVTQGLVTKKAWHREIFL